MATSGYKYKNVFVYIWVVFVACVSVENVTKAVKTRYKQIRTYENKRRVRRNSYSNRPNVINI